jgi:hypothetical protein
MISPSLKRYYRNRPAMLAYARSWERQNRSARTAYKRRWRAANPPTPEQRERQRASCRRWYRRNRERILRARAPGHP